MKKTKVVCVGEALIDRIRNKTNRKFTDYLGGAPANVACALRRLKIDSTFIGCLGDDEFGEKFIDQFKKLKVNTDFLQLDENLPTRIVKVDRDNYGDRYFSGFEKNLKNSFADESLKKNLIEKDLKSLENLFLKTKYLVAGTNVLTSPLSFESIYFLLNNAIKFNVKIIFDLNWRVVFWEYSNFSSKISKKDRYKLISDFLNYAHILKLAKEEALLFFENENPYEISAKMSNKPDVIITDGANSIKWFINGIQGTTEVPKSSKIVDTTGAGDAFLAGLISKLVSSNYPLSEFEIQSYINFASVCGLLTCLGEGAIEQQPNYAQVSDFLGSHIL